ncbi:hypothetical protein H7J86_29410 [Mycobacterium hackensackense]|uniref:hypothetical protein n=1 Tax=Mycobacterium hackensackense TaxID=228909 RepID=UPI002265AFC3|nr:hypothetical protein [Mycobacterium hackensackense]MCV7256299.1 hypothetical protein [Mycobacterium hackensackense]
MIEILTAGAAKVIVGVGTFMGADMAPLNDPSSPHTHATASETAGPGGAVVLPPHVPAELGPRPAAGSPNQHVPTIVIPRDQATGGANPHIPYGTNPLVPYGTWTP